jgi:hypothetical protein
MIHHLEVINSITNHDIEEIYITLNGVNQAGTRHEYAMYAVTEGGWMEGWSVIRTGRATMSDMWCISRELALRAMERSGCEYSKYTTRMT